MGCICLDTEQTRKSRNYENFAKNEKGEVIETLKGHNLDKPEITTTNKHKSQSNYDDLEIDAPTAPERISTDSQSSKGAPPQMTVPSD